MKILLLFCLFCVGSIFGGSTKWMPCADNRSAMVHLFEWKWKDIEAECVRFLGPKGYCAVQISPPNEHIIYNEGHVFRPWWERYQPVSYKLVSRSGNENEFKSMVETCNNHGVRIIVDAVIQHMAAASAGSGSGGSQFNPNSLWYPGVPYFDSDFNCCNCHMCNTNDCNIHNYGDVNQVRNCRLVGLRDLALGRHETRQKVINYMNHMIGIGVAGFRIDAVKHTWPGDIEQIVRGLHNLNTRWFNGGTRPFVASEVIDLGGEPIKGTQYTHIGRVTEFKYGAQLGRVFRKYDKLSYLKNFGTGWGHMSSEDSFVFIDNHDNQRGHGAGGRDILSFYFPKQFKMAVGFMLSWPHGFPRIMSSYSWDGGPYNNDWIGPPHHGDGGTKDVPINQDGTCGDRWVCEHRWRQIFGMVGFRNAAGGAGVTNWWDNGNNQIAFARQGRAFVVFNNEDGHMDHYLQTSLPGGNYCDVISGVKDGGRCTGATVHVGGDGRAKFSLDGHSENPMIAIHVDAKL